jgi:predicted Zn-dependent peptidase
MYLDTPSEQIYDDFEEIIFKEHPLGLSILGSHKTLDNIKRKDVLNFIKEHYIPSNAVLSASTPSGEIHFNKLAQKYFGKNITNTVNKNTTYKINKSIINKNINRNVVQAHTVIGNFAFARNNSKRTSLVLLNNLLGGPGMNSRLNLNIREKYGFTYQIDSSYQTYTETGIFSIYYSTDFSKKERTEELIYKELNILCKKKLSLNQLNAAKRQFIGQLTLSRENVLNMVLGAGKSVLYKGHVESFSDVIKRIDKISSSEILETANQIFEPKKLSVLNYVKL